MHIGIPRPGPSGLVTATPATIPRLIKLGYEVIVQAGAGHNAHFSDAAYVEAGAQIVDEDKVWSAGVVITYDSPTPNQRRALRPHTTLISMLDPTHHDAEVAEYVAQQITALSLDAVPRISRAQSLDVLSSMSNVAGYRGVIEAAQRYRGMFAGQVTAAGKTPPATVFVIGAGVAGLAALGAAGSLGAQVRAFDVRPEVAEQIESMGATFVRAPQAQQQISTDGYAQPLTQAQQLAALDVYAEQSAKADVVVTTALIRGRAPITITADMVAAMKPGSIIVDLAASGGGNCELTVPGQVVESDNGVTIIGYTDWPKRMAAHSSQLLATNVVNLLTIMTPGKDGELVIDLDDVIIRGMAVSHQGDLLWPPPPIQVSATPAAATRPEVSEQERKLAQQQAQAARRKKLNLATGIGAAALFAALAFAPTSLISLLTVLMLAIVVGFYVISGVSHSLHTPLMSQTNAISAIILVGAILQIGSSNLIVTILATIAAGVAAINVFGGFAVTYRMLGMFTKEH